MRPLIAACCLLLCAPALAGDLTERFQLTLDRVLSGGPPYYNDELVLADAAPKHVRRFTNFSGDVSGRYIEALTLAARQTGQRFPQLDRIVAQLVPFQKGDGHFGDPLSVGEVQNDDMAILWGNGRLLIGLAEYNQLSQRPEVLAAARRLGDFLVKLAPVMDSEAIRQKFDAGSFAVGYICWTQNIEGLVELYRLTNDARYRDLAAEMAVRTERQQSQHSHGFLSSVRGIVELYKATNDRKYLDQAEREWEGVMASGNVLVQGAVPEAFNPGVRRKPAAGNIFVEPPIRRDEGCSEADWLRLSLALWQITHKPEYLRQAEITLFNEFSYNQFPTGDFGHHELSGSGYGYRAARAWWCCTLHGLRAFPDVAAAVFRNDNGAICYDLPVDGRVEAGGLALRAVSSLGKNGTIRLEVTRADGRPRALAIRQPEWASQIDLAAGLRRQPGLDGYSRVERAWKTGEVIEIHYQMRTRLVGKPGAKNQVAVFHGPWLLAVDERVSPSYFDEPHPQNRVLLPAAGAKGELWLEPAAASSASSGKAGLAVPVAHLKLDFLPGGYAVQPQTAILRPIAEYTTGDAAGLWEFWLPVKE